MMLSMLIPMMGVPIPVYLHYRNNVIHAYSHDGSPNSSVFTLSE